MNRRFKKYVSQICAVVFGFASLFPAQVVLADTSAPSITHELIREGQIEQRAFVVSATITDDSTILEVKLNYRLIGGDQQFKSRDMEKGAADSYTFTISAKEMLQPGIEYYITALDSAGNSQSRGFVFDPLTLSVVAPTISTASTSESDSNGKSNILWYVLGGLALAGLAAAAGGGDGGEELCPCPLGVEN